MSRSLVVFALLAFPALARADAFDLYTNPVLAKVPGAAGVKQVKQLPADTLVEHGNVIPGSQAAFLMVQSNDGSFCKLLVQSARKRLNDENKTLVPVILIERFVSYKAGTEQTVVASGQNVMLFGGFRFSLDLGQVVPEKLGGDLRFVIKESEDKSEAYLETLGSAKMYLLTKALPDINPKKKTKFVLGETFEPKYFNGKFKLYDDGRRSGTLLLEVAKDGEVTGSYYSDKDGQKYEVTGKIAQPKHAIRFSVKFPRTEQQFSGWMFTGDGLKIAGFSKLQDREAGFYAVRVEE